ncbi:hypothetical protein LUZ60_005361 [Juncus effusus]|nr:hypothetical protein LUZ60_005361 [Juncus effusus]
MAMKNRIILPALVTLVVFLLSAISAVSYEIEDPELTRCMESCHSQPHYDIGMKRRCEEQCLKEHQQRMGEQQEGERGSGESQDREDPAEQRFRECRSRCRQQHKERKQQSRCMTKCEEEYREERRQGGGNPHQRYEGEGVRGEERKRENPYVFGKERFRYEHRTDHGFVKVLDKFHEKSNLLLGLANYTIEVLVADPRTFVMPTHFDADCVCYVFKGRGTLTILGKGEKESHEIREGDIFVTSAGSIIYMVSSDPRERLVVVKFLRSVSMPGQIMHFHVAGGRNPESIYRHFSEEVLEAAFRAPIDQIENVIGRQRKGAFIRASQEQIQGLRRHSKEGGSWPFGESRGPFNLLKKQATHSNRYGALFEADSKDYRQLQHLNVRVSLANVTDGSMMAPFYNSRSTKVAMVVQGSGYIEIICPHLARKTQRGHGTQRHAGQEEQEERGRQRYGEEEEEYEGRGTQGQQRYKKIRAYLSQGMVFVVPAGHPVVEVASADQNLQAICFEIRADRNERIFLAGRNNILNKMEKEAKELAFDTSAQEVDQVFNAQREEAFFPGPGSRRQQRDKRSDQTQTIVESLLNVAARF